ncbi:hypothetical protein NAT51_02785 [Flavobacterium amniphilum]|uniref:hypothetical protein n=1 Tax=Flavobacterium amniphilum TaxID=1834035 RepID=UPI00202A9993|nr:hypothetical protein [Flavobacterium amniphilum]MCL9804430.1 hypothetical protein [Flavobacterium amniphilum]
MLTLKSSDIKSQKFYLEIKNKITGKINKHDGTTVTSDEIKKIILAGPEELIQLNNDLINQIILDFDQNEFEDYLKLNKDKRPKNTKYHLKIKEIEGILNYSRIVGNDYFLADLLNQLTCIHCNRNYIITVGSKNSKVTRPEYDHWFSKSKYPLLALSFYNLVPSCSSCNKKKSNKNFQLKTHLNPYCMSDDEKNFRFSFKKKNFIDNNVDLKIETSDNSSRIKIENFFNEMNLKQIYDKHSNLELRDLLDLRYKYSENYIDLLIKTFGNILSKEEIYRMVFGIEIKEEDFHKRPFSKFKKDIIDELLSIK